MTELFNQHSYIITAIILLAMAGIALRRMRQGTFFIRLAGWFMLMMFLGASWLVFRPSPPHSISTMEEAENLIGNDTPTVLEFYSAY